MGESFMKTKHFFIGLIIISVLFIPGCGKISRKNQSTISVFGTGTVLAQPDIVQMGITLSNVANTTKMAQDEVNKMVRQALAVLKNAGIEDKNIMTASLTFRSEHEYTPRRILIGQRAEQSISFSVEIEKNSERVSEIIDRLIQINGLELNQINFGVKNNTDYFVKSRELAFQKALEKANQYAELSNLKIIKVLKISEDANQQISPLSNRLTRNSMADEIAAGSAADSTMVPMGELEITTRIFIEFLLK
jgi:uncharacterized protein YggE